jgi:hypothetical protein
LVTRYKHGKLSSWSFIFVFHIHPISTQYFIFYFICRAKREIFSHNLALGYMTKTQNQIIHFFLHQNQNILFSNIGNRIFPTIHCRNIFNFKNWIFTINYLWKSNKKEFLLYSKNLPFQNLNHSLLICLVFVLWFELEFILWIISLFGCKYIHVDNSSIEMFNFFIQSSGTFMANLASTVDFTVLCLQIKDDGKKNIYKNNSISSYPNLS